jgi:hypothetical protein
MAQRLRLAARDLKTRKGARMLALRIVRASLPIQNANGGLPSVPKKKKRLTCKIKKVGTRRGKKQKPTRPVYPPENLLKTYSDRPSAPAACQSARIASIRAAKEGRASEKWKADAPLFLGSWETRRCEENKTQPTRPPRVRTFQATIRNRAVARIRW